MYSDAAFNLFLIQCEFVARSRLLRFVFVSLQTASAHKLISFEYLSRGKAFRGCLSMGEASDCEQTLEKICEAEHFPSLSTDSATAQ